MRKWLPYAVLSTVDTIAAASSAPRLRRWTKPLLMPALALTVLPGNETDNSVRLGAALALAGSAIGDIALLKDSDTAFVAGVGGFLAGHAGWLLAASRTPGSGGFIRQRPWLVTPFAGGLAGAGVMLLPQTPRRLRPPVALYGSVLSVMGAMGVNAAGRLPRGRGAATAAGAVLFVCSDALLAAHRFRGLGGEGRGEKLTRAAIMATYTAAQGLLAYGLMGS